MVDSLSKYIEVERVKSVSVQETVNTLRIIFSRNGLPDTLVSDNATSFTGCQFVQFLSDNDIKHVTSPPYMPASNGQAERGVRVVKDSLNKQNKADSLQCWLARALLCYRSTPQNTTNVAPSVLLNGRKLINAKDRIYPKYCNDSEKDECKLVTQFSKGDKVLALNLREGPKWYSALVIHKLAINVYNVYVEELDVIWKRHKNQLALV